MPLKAMHTSSLRCGRSWSDNIPCLRSAQEKRESTEGTLNRELADRHSSQRDVDVLGPSSPTTPCLIVLSFHRAGGTIPMKTGRGDGLPSL